MKKLLVDPVISNNDFVITIKLMQDNFTPEKHEEFVNQMIHTKFLCPVLFDPNPEISQEGLTQVPANTKVLLSSLKNKKGESYLVAYTDNKEADRQKQGDNQHTLACSYFDFCTIIQKEGSPYAGFVINPFSENVIISKQTIEMINKNIHMKRRVDIPRK